MCSWGGEAEISPTRRSPSALPSSPGNERLITKIILAILAPNSFADRVPTSGRRWVKARGTCLSSDDRCPDEHRHCRGLLEQVPTLPGPRDHATLSAPQADIQSSFSRFCFLFLKFSFLHESGPGGLLREGGSTLTQPDHEPHPTCFCPCRPPTWGATDTPVTCVTTLNLPEPKCRYFLTFSYHD